MLSAHEKYKKKLSLFVPFKDRAWKLKLVDFLFIFHCSRDTSNDLFSIDDKCQHNIIIVEQKRRASIWWIRIENTQKTSFIISRTQPSLSLFWYSWQWAREGIGERKYEKSFCILSNVREKYDYVRVFIVSMSFCAAPFFFSFTFLHHHNVESGRRWEVNNSFLRSFGNSMEIH